MPDVDIDLIKPSPYQPRLFFDTDDLKEEIQRDGLLSALVVRKKDEYYELLDGERRLRTLKDLGWKTAPIDIRNVDDSTARRSVFKLNKIRENYNTEEEARYYKKLADEGMTFFEIGKELNVDAQWVLAHLNVFKFPEDIQKATWEGKYLTISHMRHVLENVIGRNMDEAQAMACEIINRNLSVADARKIVSDRDKEADDQRLQAAKRALPEVIAGLETPEDYKKAAKALQEEAKRRAEEAMTPEEKAVQEAEKKARAEAQALVKAAREEEKRQNRAEEERHRQERAEKRARDELKRNKAFIQEALKGLSQEERIEILGLVPSPEKPKEPKSLTEQFQEAIKQASQLVTRIEKLRTEPGFHELDLKSFALDLYMLADAFTEFSEKVGGSHGKKK